MKDKGGISAGRVTGASSEEEGGVVDFVQGRVQDIGDGDGKLSSFELN